MQIEVSGSMSDSMQIDLQTGLVLDSVLDVRANNLISEHAVVMKQVPSESIHRDGDVYWIVRPFSSGRSIGSKHALIMYYHGQPVTAKNPPWSGGFIWAKDSQGNPWTAVACQGLGASSWWPCKDYQGDEPDSGVTIRIHDKLSVAISNGRHFGPDTFYVENAYTGETTVRIVENFSTSNPINLYNLTFYLGDYTTFTDTFHGEKGVLPLTFHPLRYNEAKARTHFAVTKDMLRCFEHWMGPYPFYKDGYKLVEAPYLGMEHQSAIAYGNKYQMGYLGTDRSGTGIGLLFDYIIIHESGHEWFGNNITAKDVADNWIHEGFTTYTETLFAEWIAGKEKAAAYNKGEWKNIDNDRPIIGAYGINDDGSGDKYDKGAAMLHMIRTVMDNDEKFRQMLRGLNKDFWHQTVTTKQVEDYITQKSGYDFSAFFNQYLRTTQIPTLEWYRKGKRIHYRFTKVVPGFSLPIGIEGFSRKLTVTEAWNSVDMQRGVEWEDNFLIKIDKVDKRSEL